MKMDAAQVYERLEDARTSCKMMASLFEDVGRYVISQRIRIAKAAVRKRSVENSATTWTVAHSDDFAAQRATKKAKKEKEFNRINRDDSHTAQPKTSPYGDDAIENRRAKVSEDFTTKSSDAEMIKRTALIYAHLREVHAMFLQEIDSTMEELVNTRAEIDAEVMGDTKDSVAAAAAPAE